MNNDGKNAKKGKPGDHPSPDFHSSHEEHPIIPPRGDYQTLHSFHKAEVVYDLTFRFAHKFLAKGDRTIDQMIQAARSGKKNLLEGSKAAQTSKETELKLTSVARASLEELLDDYRDYLRVREHREWDKDSKEALYVRQLGRKVPQTYELYREFVETRPPEVVANIAICLIHQANYLIDQQLRRLEKDFLEQGGLRERMLKARLEYRNKNHGKNTGSGAPRPPQKALPHPLPPSPGAHKMPLPKGGRP
jgi:four helix bundle suffix protein